MTVDLSVAPADQSATLKRQIVTYTGPTSYTTGGDALDDEVVRFGTVLAILNLTISNGTAVLHGWYNVSTGKIMWFAAAGTEVASLTNLSGYTGRMEFVGR